ALLLALCALGTGLGVAARPAAPTPADPPTTQAPAAAQAPKDEDTGVSTFAGRVLDPDGKPLAGAKVYLVYYTPKVLPIPVRATTGKDGTFRFTAARKDFDASISVRPWDETIPVATADGYGLGLPSWARGEVFKRTDVTIRLTKDDVPITGRLLDLQGRPVAGVSVRVHGYFRPTGPDLTAWLRELKDN